MLCQEEREREEMKMRETEERERREWSRGRENKARGGEEAETVVHHGAAAY